MKYEFAMGKSILLMREFQKQHNIKGQCITNVQYLYDAMKHNAKYYGFQSNEIVVKPVIVLSNDSYNNVTNIVSGHLVVMINDIILDPSYEVFSKPNKIYFETIQEFTNSFDKTIMKREFNVRELMLMHIKFEKFANDITKGKFIICDKDFYDNQADYVETKLKTLYKCDLIPKITPFL